MHGDQVQRLATSLPSVAGVTYDRAFPNTLRVVVQAEEPAAVVRHGARAWLVSRRGRLMERIAQRTHRKLPRIWLARALGVPVGATLAPAGGAEEVALIDALRGEALERQVRSVRQVEGQWTYVLRGGVQIRVGDRADIPLKLAVAAAILRRTADLRLSRRERSTAPGRAREQSSLRLRSRYSCEILLTIRTPGRTLQRCTVRNSPYPPLQLEVEATRDERTER